jgi:hypothetical protein
MISWILHELRKSSGALYHCVSLRALAKTFVKTREIQTTFSGEKSCKTLQIDTNSIK